MPVVPGVLADEVQVHVAQGVRPLAVIEHLVEFVPGDSDIRGPGLRDERVVVGSRRGGVDLFEVNVDTAPETV